MSVFHWGDYSPTGVVCVSPAAFIRLLGDEHPVATVSLSTRVVGGGWTHDHLQPELLLATNATSSQGYLPPALLLVISQ